MLKEKNRFARMKEVMLFDNGSVLRPSRGMFYLTLKCNLSCKMCFQKDCRHISEELSLEEIKNIFQDIQLSSIHLVGGEIFTRPDIYEVLSYFNSRYKNISIQTNATLIDESGIQKLIEMPNIQDIWISIDGLSKVHNLIRGAGVFERAKKVICALNGHKRIFINTVILKENVDYLQNIYQYFNELNVYKITFQFEMGYCADQYNKTKNVFGKQKWGTNATLGRADKKNADFLYANSLIRDINILLENEKGTKISFYPEIFVDNISHYIHGDIREKYKVVCNDFVEPVLKINSKGDVLLCEAFNLSIGNLKQDKLEDIWNSDYAKNIRHYLSQVNLTDMCSRCCCLLHKKV